MKIRKCPKKREDLVIEKVLENDYKEDQYAAEAIADLSDDTGKPMSPDGGRIR